MTTKVTLVIKNPSQPQDFRLELPLAATVLALKSAIEEDYISKPRVDLQRLIFSGRLLRDEEVLSDVFRLADLTLPQICHLVIKPQINQAPPQQQYYPQQQPQQQQGYYAPQQQQPYYMNQQQQYNPNMYPGNIQQQQPYPGYNNNNNNNNNNNMPQQNPFINLQQQNMQQRQAQGRVFHLNLTLIFKLGLMVVVLSQGGSNERLAFLIAAAIMIYIYQTMRPRPPDADDEIPPELRQPEANNNNNNNNNQQQQQQQQANPAAGGGAPQNNAQQPRQSIFSFDWQQYGGIVGEVLGFFVPLVFSVFPSWQPDYDAIEQRRRARQQQQQQQQQPPAQPDPQHAHYD